jgi:hypothetical protein
MNVERKADNRPVAEPARGSDRRAGLEPELGSVEEGAEKSKGAVSKSVVPLLGDRRFESLSLHRLVRLSKSISRLPAERLAFTPAMPFVHRFGQRVGDSGTHADQRGFLDAEFGRDLISCAEADAADVAGRR